LGPGPSFFELGGETEEGGFITVACDEVSADREALVVPIEGD
jgi:hypothetical protein